MPVITKIVEQRRAANRRNIYLDGQFAFGCNLNVVARFRLVEGMDLTTETVTEIQQGEVRQECLDKALRLLESRLHSRAELSRKLKRHEYGDPVIEGVLDDLTRMGYVDDERFAKTKALTVAEHRHHGRRRAYIELMKSGIKGEVAQRALEDVYSKTDSSAMARQIATKQAPRLRNLDRAVGRRRLIGLLQRRGFDFDTIRPIVEEVLGKHAPGDD